LIRRLARQQKDFVLVQPWIDEQEWSWVFRDPTHPLYDSYVRHVAGTIGRGPLARFDPDLDFFARYPCNAGVFASRRLAITEVDLAQLNEAERVFYRDVLGREAWTWRSKALFFRDEGCLNYLVAKLAIPVLPLRPELVCVAGASAVEVAAADVGRGACDFHVVHWMGAKSPSPSLFCRGPLFRIYALLWSFVGGRKDCWIAPGYERLPECVGYSLWRHHHEGGFGPMRWRARLRWSWIDVRRSCRLCIRCLKLLGRSLIGSRLQARLPSPSEALAAAAGPHAGGLSRPSPADTVPMR
jgi:hypothetical protein